jgi:hypothetical protein
MGNLPAHVVAAVPCLKHELRRVQGPERQLVLSLETEAADASQLLREATFDVAAKAKANADAEAEDEARRAVEQLLADLPPSRLLCSDVAWVVLERCDSAECMRAAAVRSAAAAAARVEAAAVRGAAEGVRRAAKAGGLVAQCTEAATAVALGPAAAAGRTTATKQRQGRGDTTTTAAAKKIGGEDDADADADAEVGDDDSENDDSEEEEAGEGAIEAAVEAWWGCTSCRIA